MKRLAVVALIAFLLVACGSASQTGSSGSGVRSAPSGTATGPKFNIPTATATPTPDVPKLLAEVEAAWGLGDWKVVTSNLSIVLTATPEATGARDKLYSAFINQGQLIEKSGIRMYAGLEYEKAQAVIPERPEAPALIAALTPTATPRPGIGSTVGDSTFDVKVLSVERRKNLVISSYGTYVPAQGEWVIIYINITNKGRDPYAFCRCNQFMASEFMLTDGSRTFMDGNSVFNIDEWRRYNGLKSPDAGILPGATVKSALVFDANVGATDFRLWMQPIQRTVFFN